MTEELTKSEHLDLKMALGKRIEAIMHEEMVEGLSPSRATMRVLDLLELPSIFSILTPQAHSELRSRIASRVQAAIDRAVATADRTVEPTEEEKRRAHEADANTHLMLSQMLTALKRGEYEK